MMQRRLDTFYSRYFSIAEKVFRHKYVKAGRQGFAFAIPALVVGSFSSLFINFPLQAYQQFMHQIFSASWELFGSFMEQASFRMIALLFLLGFTYDLSDTLESTTPSRGVVYYRSFASILVSISCYVLFASLRVEGLNTFQSGSPEIFTALIIGIFSTEIFYKISRFRRMQINVNVDSSNLALTKIYETLPAAILTMLIFGVGRVLVAVFFDRLPSYNLTDILVIPISNNAPAGFLGAMLFGFLDNFLWFFGIHGGQALLNYYSGVFYPAQTVNSFAATFGLPAPYVATSGFLSVFVFLGGTGAPLCLLIGVLAQGKKSSLKQLARLALLPTLFNVDEIVLFGVPLVLNPIFFIPFILVAPVLCVIAYVAMKLGLVAPVTQSVGVHMPPFLSAYFATGDWRAIVLHAVQIAVGAAFYFPFVRLWNKFQNKGFMEAKAEVINASMTRYVVEDYYLTRRVDMVGTAARTLSVDLREAIRKGELALQYQPKVDYLQQTVCGMEALVRWRHKEHGVIPPPVIVALADEGGFADQLARWVSEAAAKTLSSWRKEGLMDMTMAINLSVKEMNDPRVAKRIGEALAYYEIPPGRFEIEIIENMELSMNPLVRASLDVIEALGIPLVIDDFGVGYSTIVYLKILPIKTLKVDKLLSVDAPLDMATGAILDSVISLCKALGIHMVIEYVESPGQARYLINHGCSVFQGYLFSPPLDADRALEYVQLVRTLGRLVASTGAEVDIPN